MSLDETRHVLDAATAEALEYARELAAAGVPLFLAPPARNGAGEWLPGGGHGGCGYWLPRGWERTQSDSGIVDRWQPGVAIAAVMGHVVDGVDVDPRHGGDASAASMAAAGCWPGVVGRQATPSGGWHDVINPLRVASRDAVLPGIDVKAGLPDGRGRGFLWLAPTVRLSKVTGEPAPYRWVIPPMLDELDPDDDSGQVLAARIDALRSPRQDAEHDVPHPAYSAMGEEQRRDVDRYLTRVVQAVREELASTADWPEGHRDDRQRGWQKLLADACNRFGQLARADWTPWTYATAYEELTGIVPDAMAAAVGLEGTWDAQKDRRPPANYPPALEDLDWVRALSGGQTPVDVAGLSGAGDVSAMATTGTDEAHLHQPAEHTSASGLVAVATRGGDGGAEKPTMAQRLTQIAGERYSFGVSTTGEPFAVRTGAPRVAVMLRGGQSSLRSELAAAYLHETGRPPSQEALTDAITALEGIALAATPPSRLALRVAREAGQIVLDVGGDDGRVVLIDSLGWRLSSESPVLFRRSPLTGVLPTPERGGDLAGLWDIINVAERDRGLLLADLVCAYFPDVPHPITALTGEQGTGKSTATRVIVSLLDASTVPLRKPPKDVETWAVAAGGSHVVAVDNVSAVPDWLSDSLCRASTGDGDVRRRLYTDGDLYVFAFKRVVFLNGIDWGAVRGDLADRLITIELERIPETGRARDDDLMQRWDAAAPRVLGGLLDLVAEVMRVLPNIHLDRSPRMADFAHIAAAVDAVTDYRSLERYLQLAGELAVDAVTSDPVLVAIRSLIVAEWEGPASVLLEQLDDNRHDQRPARGWPANARALAQTLKRQAPALRRLGWTVERTDRKTERGIVWKLSPPAAEPDTEADEALTKPSDRPLVSTSSAPRQPPGTEPELREQAKQEESPDGMTRTPHLSLLSHQNQKRNREEGDPSSSRQPVSWPASQPVPLADIIAELGGPCATCLHVVCTCPSLPSQRDEAVDQRSNESLDDE